MGKTFKTSELKFKFIPKAWKREAMAHKTTLKGCSLKIEILTRLLYHLLFKPDGWMCHGWVCIFEIFCLLQKRETNDKVGYVCQA